MTFSRCSRRRGLSQPPREEPVRCVRRRRDPYTGGMSEPSAWSARDEGGRPAGLPAALQYAIEAVRRREKAMTARFEVVGARQARDARQELEELVETLEAVDV